ncbi:unnamed protein product [Didymodactylos carnosus]|uniref:INTS8 TPR repeats domain-containing protein n=1 Tax=Didymodactylos carnosus TaxID=1234261 RepID=A0A814C7V2_9BILA|nr:unnamed protein product [Didymodactylos carnosus]CAF0939524.1 unnamed protein product [Didymodactylos carnosus]CAF3555031.1 unnamed protein product [Didymodactylos carnosus]CAF3716213.1 unnamed protein product [Didymodactylos carnosus]
MTEFSRTVTSSVASQSSSWFEFLLNPTLLDEYLTQDNLEVAGTDLIIQFLIHANLIEQKTKKPTDNPNEIELKDNKIKALRFLAMKIAAKLNWDLVIIEKRIPVAVQSDLIHCFVRLTTNSVIDKCYKDREQFQQLSKVDEPALFAVQLLHRWIVRTVVQSSFPVKQAKIFPVNLKYTILYRAGYVNPLQHMKEPNENVIQMAKAKVRDSIQALDTLLEWKKEIICIPLETCFGFIDYENGNVNYDWSKMVNYPLVECLARVAYDLGSIYFYEQNYVNAYTMFRRVHDVRSQINLNYFSSLDGYLTSLQSINPSMEQRMLKPKDRIAMALRASSEDCISVLAEDNDTKEMSMAARMRLEDRLDVGSQQYKIVCSFNLVRALLDGKHLSNIQYAFDYLDTALQRVKKVNPKQQALLHNFLRIHFQNLTKNLQDQLRTDKLSHLVGQTFIMPPLKPILSPTYRSSTVTSTIQRRVNASELFKIQNRLIHSFEPDVIIKTINDIDKMKQLKMLDDLFPPNQSNNVIEKQLSPILNTNLLIGQYIRILYVKAQRAKQFKHYSLARKLLLHAAELLSPLPQQQDTTKLIKYIRYELLLIDLNDSIHKQNFDNQDTWDACRTFLTDTQSENDASVDVIRVALSYALSRGEWHFLHAIQSSSRRNRQYLDLTKILARLCITDSIRPEITRELWDRVLDILSDKKVHRGNRHHQHPQQQQDKLTAINFQKFLLLIYNPTIISILFSLLTRMYSIVLVEQSHIDIYSDYARYWPTTIVDQRQRSVHIRILANIIYLCIKHIQTIKFQQTQIQIKSSLLRTQGDLYLTLQQYTLSTKSYLCSITLDTMNNSQHVQDHDMLIRNLIKSTLQLGYHTQVACLCQLLNQPDYNIIFKTLQENFNLNDDIDDYYDCVWDLALMEILINNLHVRGYEDKKKLAIRVCKQKELNGNNSDENRLKMIRIKKRLLLKKLLAHYLLPFNRLYRPKLYWKYNLLKNMSLD